MTAYKAARKIRLHEWARQIEECHQSGMPIQQRCKENGIGYKNYFYRQRRVREELLDAMESNTALMLNNNLPTQQAPPVFAAVPAARMNEYRTVAATIQIGTYIAEINNGADLETVDGILRTLSRL